MHKEEIVIVIPMHRADLKPNEEVSLLRCKEVFADYHVVLVHPNGLNINNYHKYECINEFLPFPSKYFKSENGYNRMLNMPFFYRPFLKYKYMLLYQLDTFVFENNLLEWCGMGYDYIGAPWIDATWVNKLTARYPRLSKLIYPVGNGGLSLRKIKKFYYGSIFLQPIAFFWPGRWHEDFFWTSVAHRLIPGFKVPDVATALKFAFEEHPDRCLEMNNNSLPFGCHAWEKFDTAFWVPHFKKYGYSIEHLT